MTTRKKKPSESGAVDLSGLAAAIKRQDAGRPVEILGLDGTTPLGLTILVAGPDSDRAQQAQEDLADELLAREDLTAKVTARQAADRGIRYLARVTMDWSPAIKLDGRELPYSVKAAEDIYRRFRFIRDQVDRAAGDRSRFTDG